MPPWPAVQPAPCRLVICLAVSTLKLVRCWRWRWGPRMMPAGISPSVKSHWWRLPGSCHSPALQVQAALVLRMVDCGAGQGWGRGQGALWAPHAQAVEVSAGAAFPACCSREVATRRGQARRQVAAASAPGSPPSASNCSVGCSRMPSLARASSTPWLQAAEAAERRHVVTSAPAQQSTPTAARMDHGQPPSALLEHKTIACHAPHLTPWVCMTMSGWRHATRRSER